MKRFFLSVSALFISGALLAQPQIDNSDMEGWEGSGASIEPIGWSSIKTSSGGVSGLAPQVCFQSTDANTGTYSVRLESKSAVGQVATGLLTNGRVHAEISGNGYVYTDAGNADYNTPLTDRPDSIVVWYKAAPEGNDFPGFEVVLHTGEGKIPENGTAANWIGTASWSGTPGAAVSEWTRVSVPFGYGSGDAPAYILLAPTSGNGTSSVAGSEVWYDDFALIYNITPVPSTDVVTIATIETPNSTTTEGNEITVDFSTSGTPLAATDFVAELSDENGNFTSPTVIGTLNTNATSGTIDAVIPVATTPGTYLIRVTNSSLFYASLTATIEIDQIFVGLAEAITNTVKLYGSGGILTVDLSGVQLERPTYEVVNMAGQRIASGRFVEGQRNQLDLSGEQGVYILRILDAENIISKKVFVN